MKHGDVVVQVALPVVMHAQIGEADVIRLVVVSERDGEVVDDELGVIGS